MTDILRFFREAYDELKRVSWLSRTQMLASTWLVILLVIIFSIYVGVVDYIIARMFGLLI
ncbi:MAG TPA: preprotein translocase subunit SecE [Elusimicrobiota bacterium]|nr:preprotein translocase subunit SecE [Elusimicrobiota bacterium]